MDRFFTLLVLPFCAGAGVDFALDGMVCGDKLWERVSA